MRGSFETALTMARWVARAASRRANAAAVGTALALMLGLGGCSMSHGGSTDADGDGYGREIDCNDGDPDIYPGASEHDQFPECCDGTAVDMDCDGMPPICACNPIPDADGDGYVYGEDCNDADPNIYPGAPEHDQFPECCDGTAVDMDCDGMPPLCACNPFPDVDGDGYLAPGDCDDGDPSVHPDAAEPPCPDDIDQNCDGIDGDPAALCEEDQDGDGYGVSTDCDDLDATINPGVTEGTCQDGIDQDCDGIDDGYICNGMADAPEDDAAPV